LLPIIDDLNNEQAHGHLCVRAQCQADFRLTGIPAVPVGVSATTGCQVFACADLCAAAVGHRPDDSEQLAHGAGECGPGCLASATGDHADCPGPAAGATVVSS
jgi:hypothetical protein